MSDPRFTKTLTSGSIAMILSCSLVSPAFAGLEEVIVTAQKQEENVQSIPLAITAITAEQMATKGITGFDGVAQTTPSISFSPFPASSTTLILYMRAQGNPNPDPINSESAVGLYEDGFLIGRPNAATFDLADMERVEVLRGPQGTLYGRNTTGGAVNLISKAPTGQFGFKQNLSFGTRDLFRSLTAIDLPKVAGFSAKVTLLKSGIDGTVKNSGSSQDFGEQQQKAGRLLVHWDGVKDVNADYFFEKGDLNSTPIYYQNAALDGMTINGYRYDGVDRPVARSYRPIDLPESTASFEGHGLTFTWDVNDAITLKSLTGYRKLIARSLQNYAEAFTAGPLFPVTFNTDALLSTHQFSQELQLVGNALDSSVNYVLGLYYFKESGSQSQYTSYPLYSLLQFGRQNALTKSKAAFGQVSWTPPILDDRLELIVGARYTKDDRSAERFSDRTYEAVPGMPVTTHIENGSADGTVNNLSFGRFNPSFTAKYQLAEDLSVYGKVTTGYRSGGSYSAAPIGQFAQTFKPEYLTNYELGLKSYWLERKVRINIAAFDAKYKDMQLVLPVYSLPIGDTQMFNVGTASIKGIEAELLVAPIDDLSISLNYSYLNATFQKVDVVAGTVFDHNANPLSPYNVGDNIKSLFVMPYAPRHSLDFGTDYTFLHFSGGMAIASVDYRWQGLVYQTSGAGPGVPGREFAAQPAYGLLNGRLTLALDLPNGHKGRVSLWGKNLADKKYPQSLIPQNGYTVAVGQAPAGYDSNAVSWAERPSYGIDFSYQY